MLQTLATKALVTKNRNLIIKRYKGAKMKSETLGSCLPEMALTEKINTQIWGAARKMGLQATKATGVLDIMASKDPRAAATLEAGP